MIKLFEEFNSYSEVKEWLNINNISDYIINDDLSVDVNGDVDLSNRRLYKIPIKFGRINGNFYCSYNKLKSLDGCPTIVECDFDCSNNELTSLDGCPIHIGGMFNCRYNKLISLVNGPKYVGVHYLVDNNEITSLYNFKCNIGKNFYCRNNKLPPEIYLIFYKNNNLIIKYQEEYGIWNSDGSFNEKRWNILYNDYKAGLIT